MTIMATQEEKIDRILDKVEELSISMAVMCDWRITHMKEHDNMSSWRRWIAPFALSIIMVCLQLFKK
jgi:hypothetical protein